MTETEQSLKRLLREADYETSLLGVYSETGQLHAWARYRHDGEYLFVKVRTS